MAVSKSSTDGQKRKSQRQFITGSGCVLGGVVLLGGGLAVAGLVAAFTIIKNRDRAARDDHDNKDSSSASAAAAAVSEKRQDATQGLSSALQNPTIALHQNSCCTNQVTPATSSVDSRELVCAQNLVLEEKPEPIMEEGKENPSCYEQEMLFSAGWNEGSIGSCNGSLNSEEPTPPAPENMIKKGGEPAEPEILTLEEDLPNLSEEGDSGCSEEHAIYREEEDEDMIAPKENSATQPVEEEEQEKESHEEDKNSPVHPVEEDGDDEDDRDYDDVYNNSDDSSEEDVTEKEEDSSEGTGSSSGEANVEAIWPTDMVEALSQDLKLMNANNQNSMEKMAKTEFDYLHNSKSECRRKSETTESDRLSNKKTPQEFVVSKIETINLPTREVCVWAVLAVVLLLPLLLHIHHKYPLQDLSSENYIVRPRV